MKKKKIIITLVVLVAIAAMAIIVCHSNPAANQSEEILKKVISCIMILVCLGAFVGLYDKVTTLPMELWTSRHLIRKLAVNDFKKRYAGSYLGVVWAMAQPVVTVLLYYIVFDKVLHSSRTEEAPFVLFLTAGLVPWFYFSESLNNATNALQEYSYLVKKVVFKISILPIIKVIAATFIHVFFVIVLIVIAAVYGYYPTVYMIQIIYYSFCMFVFTLAISYTTCAITVFFRDLTQIIAILLQIGMWATPILWDINTMSNNVVTLLKLNPLVYIVNGYRESIYGDKWFFQDFFSTMYFWIVTLALFGLGALIFKRLKPHFADIL